MLFGGIGNAFIGGPDGFGYRYIDSNEDGGPTFAYEDISLTGTVSDVSDDDDSVEIFVPLGFSFTFYGDPFINVNISSNGKSSLRTHREHLG